MRAAGKFDEGAPVHVMSAEVLTDDQIAQIRGRIMAQMRRQGWSYAAIGKLFRCSDRWVRVEIRDVPPDQRRRTARVLTHDEDEEIALAV